MKVVILRGVPGAGKSRYARENFPEANVCSADHFFMKDGEYKFDPNKLAQAHGACLRKFIDCIGVNGEVAFVPIDTVVVDNTGTSVVEIAPYAALANAYGCELEIITLEVDPKVAAARNVHGVPETSVLRMAQNLEHGTKQLPPWWPHKVVKQ